MKTLDANFIVLIAKMEGAKDVRLFRPISLVDCIYKLIFKVLSRRLSRVLGDVIGESQQAFVKDR